MKAGEHKKIATSFAPFFPSPWRRIGKEFCRRAGDWIQIVPFNCSRFSDSYVPRSCFEFLKMPGDPNGTFLLRELSNPNGTQRWVTLKESPAQVFAAMAEQFRPALLAPLQLEEIETLLQSWMEYWPHAYALCVMSAEQGREERAREYFQAFLAATADRPYPALQARRKELEEILQLLRAPAELKHRLAVIAAGKLRAMKMEP